MLVSCFLANHWPTSRLATHTTKILLNFSWIGLQFLLFYLFTIIRFDHFSCCLWVYVNAALPFHRLKKIPMSHKSHGLSQYLHGFMPSGHRDIIWYCPFSPANHCWLLSEDSHVTQVSWIKSILTWFHAIRTQGYHLILSILPSKPLLTT